MATDVERSEVGRCEVERSEILSVGGCSERSEPWSAAKSQTRKSQQNRVRLGQAHKPRDKQSSLAYLTRCLDDSCGKRRRARPAKKRHQHSTASDQSECGVSPYVAFVRTKHGEES